MRLRFGGGFECFFWQCMASSVMIWPRNIEFFQQFLHRRYLVGLFVDLDMRQHQRRIDGKSAEYLSCFGIVKGVETALERFAVKRQNACVNGRCAAVEACRVLAK